MNKEAFQLVSSTFEKIAKEKEVNTKGLRKNVTGRALGAGVLGAIGGGEVGAISSISAPTMNSMKNRIIGGAAIGAGLNMANSIRKNVKHNRKIDDIQKKLDEKTAFSIVNDCFEKIAKTMPYTLSNGDYATPMGYDPAFASQNDDIEGTWENDYYRKNEGIPGKYKRIADSGYGDSIFVDTESDKNSPLYGSYDHDAGFRDMDDDERDELFSTYNIHNKNYEVLKKKGLNTTQGIDGLNESQLKDFGYAKPGFKDTMKSVGRTAKRTLGTVGTSALLGAGLGATSVDTFKDMKMGALVGGGFGTAVGLGLNHMSGGFKLDDTAKIRQDKIKKSLKNDMYTDKINDDFLSQYKTASDIVMEAFTKISS